VERGGWLGRLGGLGRAEGFGPGREREMEKERGMLGWVGKEKREALFVFFKHKHHLNDYFEFKQNLNFGCYSRCYNLGLVMHMDRA